MELQWKMLQGLESLELSYKKAIEAGRTRAEALDIAGFYAKDIINFSRAGLYGRAWNRYSAFLMLKYSQQLNLHKLFKTQKQDVVQLNMD